MKFFAKACQPVHTGRLRITSCWIQNKGGLVSYFLIFMVMLKALYFPGTSNTELPGEAVVSSNAEQKDKVWFFEEDKNAGIPMNHKNVT